MFVCLLLIRVLFIDLLRFIRIQICSQAPEWRYHCKHRGAAARWICAVQLQAGSSTTAAMQRTAFQIDNGGFRLFPTVEFRNFLLINPGDTFLTKACPLLAMHRIKRPDVFQTFCGAVGRTPFAKVQSASNTSVEPVESSSGTDLSTHA